MAIQPPTAQAVPDADPDVVVCAVNVEPGGRTSSDLDRASVNDDVENHLDDYDANHYDDNYDYNVEERSAIPYTDEVTRLLIDLAIETLAGLRSPLGARDPGARLSCLLSLCGEADGGLPDAVADARDHGYGWDDIAMRLASTPAAVRRRYSAYTRWRASAPTDIDRGRP
jgi:hypothetical protein